MEKIKELEIQLNALRGKLGAASHGDRRVIKKKIDALLKAVKEREQEIADGSGTIFGLE